MNTVLSFITGEDILTKKLCPQLIPLCEKCQEIYLVMCFSFIHKKKNFKCSSFFQQSVDFNYCRLNLLLVLLTTFSLKFKCLVLGQNQSIWLVCIWWWCHMCVCFCLVYQPLQNEYFCIIDMIGFLVELEKNKKVHRICFGPITSSWHVSMKPYCV